MGTQLPLPYRGTVPQFSAIVRCGQTTRWTNMALGMEVGLGPGDFVRGGPSYPQNREHTHHHPVFGPCLLWPNGWMDEDATWYGSRPRPRPQRCIRWGPISYPRMGHSSPLFSAHIYCGHGRPSQLLLSSCCNWLRFDNLQYR